MSRWPKLVMILSALLVAVACAGAEDADTVADSSVAATEATRQVAGGGIAAEGWLGRIDANEARDGATLEQARLEQRGDSLVVTTGPAVVYWHPANTATGDYTVSATFHEPQYMNVNDHAHPYGLFIGGSAMGTDQQSMLYCAAYGNGRFIVRGFGPESFQLNGRGEEHQAVNRAAGRNQPVTQQIALSVRGDSVSCAINGTTVGSYPRSTIVTEGRLDSTDGIYGIRFGHNTDAIVTGLTTSMP
ncbi:MAG TPA: hypothetical protein VMM18_17095 [Gemmatimonadaceae bacterium]|nr:hypothetical protein [Gemmatimonadaceae bacterium]